MTVDLKVRKLVRQHMAEIERLARKDNPGGRYGNWMASTVCGRIGATELRPGYTRVRLVWDNEHERIGRRELERWYAQKLGEQDTNFHKRLEQTIANLKTFKA